MSVTQTHLCQLLKLIYVSYSTSSMPVTQTLICQLLKLISRAVSEVTSSSTDTRRMTVDRKLTFFTVRHEIHRLFGYIHWSTNMYELSHAPLATEYVCFFRVIRHEDAALTYISRLIVMKLLCQFHNSDIRCQLFYLNHIPIRA